MFFTEFDRLGWNWLTVSSVVLITLSIWQYRAYTVQAIAIWRSKATKSISLAFAASVFFILAGGLYYGLYVRSLTITVTGGLCIPAFAVLLGTVKFGSPTRRDWAAIAIGIATLGAYMLPVDPAWVFSVFAFATVIPLTAQLHELHKTGSRGVVSGELLATFVTKNTFFTVFAFAFGDLVYQIFAPIWLVLSAWLILKWLRLPSE